MEPTVTRVLLIYYANAREIQNLLFPLVDTAKGGYIQVDERSNALLVTERPSRMNDIQAVIERLDRPPHQVLIEAKLFEIVRQEHEDRESKDGEGDSPESTAQTGSASSNAVYNSQEANRILSQLEATKDTRLVSSFNVVTLDGKEAHVTMVKRFPVPRVEFDEKQGGLRTQSIDYQEFDISMKVRPEVSYDGFIRLSITPVVSSRVGEVRLNDQAGTASLPIISTKSMSTEVRLKSGSTVAIGGLSDQISGSVVTPQLTESSPPQRGSNKDTAEFFTSRFLIFVTARTLNPDGTSYRDTADPRVLHEMEIVDSEIPGYKIPEEQLKSLNKMRDLRNDSDRAQTEQKNESTLSELLNEKKQGSGTAD